MRQLVVAFESTGCVPRIGLWGPADLNPTPDRSVDQRRFPQQRSLCGMKNKQGQRPVKCHQRVMQDLCRPRKPLDPCPWLPNAVPPSELIHAGPASRPRILVLKEFPYPVPNS